MKDKLLVLETARKLNIENEILEWVKDFSISDPSLKEDELYHLALAAATDTSEVKGMVFNRNLVNIEMPLPYKKESNNMIKLIQELQNKQENNPSSLVSKTCSQIGQDNFIINLFNEKKNGLFVDIGAGPPKFINNTYLLEKDYNWDGISIEAAEISRIQWKESDRVTKFLCEDALKIDYNQVIGDLLKKHNKTRIDFLDVDLEPPSLTLEVLFKIIINSKYRFSTIIFEHDSWRESTHLLKTSRQLLERHGYILVADNVNNQEDWWIDGSY